jgi:hypothetical protein
MNSEVLKSATKSSKRLASMKSSGKPMTRSEDESSPVDFIGL